MEVPNSIGKMQLWKYINNKIDMIIQSYHIYGVMSILFDEMIKDFKSGKEIKIFNFGKIFLRQNESRKYFNVKYQKVMLSGKNKILKFYLAPSLRKKLCGELDIDKTFEES